jgi:integrase
MAPKPPPLDAVPIFRFSTDAFLQRERVAGNLRPHGGQSRHRAAEPGRVSRRGDFGILMARRSPCAAFRVIAEQLGHADTRMTEKHYAHLAPSYVADTIRAHFPTLGIAEESTVTLIRRRNPRIRRASRS